MNIKKYKLLYFVSEDEYFISHKFDQLKAALETGLDVLVVSNFRKYEEKIKKSGFKTKHLNFNRKSLNPLNNLHCLLQFLIIVLKFKPDILQANALKPILYTSIISFLIKKQTKIILCVVGLGYIFIRNNFLNNFLANFYVFMIKFFLRKKNSLFIFQNNSDENFFLKNGLACSSNSKIIRGSGVDTNKFISKKIKKTFDLIFHSRLLYDKGFGEMVAALKILKKKKKQPRVLILGDPDPFNRASIGKGEIISLVKKGVCTWEKKVTNVIPFLQKSKIAILPSYREGLPKSLLEAASCKLAIISTDVPGCRDICKNGYNGLLVPSKDAVSLSVAIEKLLNNGRLVKEFGENGRKLVLENFSLGIISKKFIKIYKTHIQNKP